MNTDTPETDKESADKLIVGFITKDGDDGYLVPANFARRLERERDEALAKNERQAERIRYLEGATNHATGTPLSKAISERDEARRIAKTWRDRWHVMMPKGASHEPLPWSPVSGA